MAGGCLPGFGGVRRLRRTGYDIADWGGEVDKNNDMGALEDTGEVMNQSRTLPRHAAATHAGHRRPHNEDSHAEFEDLGLYLVADGMGGHEAGEVASRIVVEHVERSVRAGEPLEQAVRGAHEAVLAASDAGEGRPGMGSTVVAAQLAGDRFRVAWAGDSRAYQMAGGLVRLTNDHSLVQEMVDRGALSDSEARSHPERSLITRAMGMPDQDGMEVDVVEGRLGPGECLLLCSDGLTEELDDGEIERILASEREPGDRVERLVDAALAAGGRDNVTVVLVEAPGRGLTRSRTTAARLVVAGAIGLAAAVGVALLGRWLQWPFFS